MRRLLIPLAALLLLLAACGDGGGEELTVEVYYRVTGSSTQVAPPLEAVELSLDPAEDLIGQVCAALAGDGEADYLSSPLPEGVGVARWLGVGDVTVLLNAREEEPEGLERTLLVSAIVLSLGGLEEVTSVTVRCGEEVYADGLTAEDIYLDDWETAQ